MFAVNSNESGSVGSGAGQNSGGDTEDATTSVTKVSGMLNEASIITSLGNLLDLRRSVSTDGQERKAVGMGGGGHRREVETYFGYEFAEVFGSEHVRQNYTICGLTSAIVSHRGSSKSKGEQKGESFEDSHLEM